MKLKLINYKATNFQLIDTKSQKEYKCHSNHVVFKIMRVTPEHIICNINIIYNGLDEVDNGLKKYKIIFSSL